MYVSLLVEEEFTLRNDAVDVDGFRKKVSGKMPAT